jgi:hypothetical protein
MCVPCLEKNCGGKLTACLCDPDCVKLITGCFDPCVTAGGSAMNCGLGCADEAGAKPAGAEAISLLLCASGSCQSTSDPACVPPPKDAGGDGAGD